MPIWQMKPCAGLLMVRMAWLGMRTEKTADCLAAGMNNRQRKTLEAIFSNPKPVDLTWVELEALFIAVGADKMEMRGSRIRFSLGNLDVAFHKPHNPKTLKPYQIALAREFFEKAGIRP